MRVINAPYHQHLYTDEVSVFLAGGIKGCRDWQAEVIAKCVNIENLVIFNPRAGVFDSNNEETFRRQVEWEYDAIEKSSIMCFWFSKETVNPITLLEFGVQMDQLKCFNRNREDIVIGADLEYQKLQDIKVQSKLFGWEGTIKHSIVEFVHEIKRTIGAYQVKE